MTLQEVTETSKNNVLAILAVVNLVILICGFGVLWGVLSTRVEEGFKNTTERYIDIRMAETTTQTRVDAIEKRINDDRSIIIGRLVALEADIKYISQSVSELKMRPDAATHRSSK
jgi:hypothetical protein